MDKQKIRKWLTSTDVPLSVISRKTNISRATLYSWKDDNTEIRDKNAYKILDVYADIIINNDGQEGEPVHLQERIIELQERVIHQQDEIISLKKERAVPIVNESFENFSCDFTASHTFDKTMSAISYVRYKNKYVWATKLGYTKSEFDMVLDKFVNPDASFKPDNLKTYDTWDGLNGLVTEKTLKSWLDERKLFLLISNSRVNPNHIHLVPSIIEYIHKDGSIVKALSYAEVNFDLFTTIAKIKFLEE